MRVLERSKVRVVGCEGVAAGSDFGELRHCGHAGDGPGQELRLRERSVLCGYGAICGGVVGRLSVACASGPRGIGHGLRFLFLSGGLRHDDERQNERETQAARRGFAQRVDRVNESIASMFCAFLAVLNPASVD